MYLNYELSTQIKLLISQLLYSTLRKRGIHSSKVEICKKISLLNHNSKLISKSTPFIKYLHLNCECKKVNRLLMHYNSKGNWPQDFKLRRLRKKRSIYIP